MAKKNVANSDSYLSRAASANANMSAATKRQRARDFANGVAEITGVRVGRKGIKSVDPMTVGLNALMFVPGGQGASVAGRAARVGRAASRIAKMERAAESLRIANGPFNPVAGEIAARIEAIRAGRDASKMIASWSSKAAAGDKIASVGVAGGFDVAKAGVKKRLQSAATYPTSSWRDTFGQVIVRKRGR